MNDIWSREKFVNEELDKLLKMYPYLQSPLSKDIARKEILRLGLEKIFKELENDANTVPCDARKKGSS